MYVVGPLGCTPRGYPGRRGIPRDPGTGVEGKMGAVLTRSAPTRALVVLLLCLGLGVTGTGTAQAHDRLVSSSPAAGSSVAAPSSVQLTFSAAIAPVGAQVVLRGPAGAAANGRPQVEGPRLTQPVTATTPGRYTVVWRVTSSDGHPISGRFEFTVKGGDRSASSTASSSSAPGNAGEQPSASATSGGEAMTSVGGGAEAETTTPLTSAKNRVGTDSTANHPWLVGGLAALALLAIGGGVVVSRRRLRDDDF